MNTNFLFAIDEVSNEVIVSESPKGSNKINFIERINRADNIVLFDVVTAFTSITNASNFDSKIFKAMDKVCQLVYLQYKQIN